MSDEKVIVVCGLVLGLAAVAGIWDATVKADRLEAEKAKACLSHPEREWIVTPRASTSYECRAR